MSIVISRPVPGRDADLSGARTFPVRMKLPGGAPWSTARFTAPITSGASCHSSSRIAPGVRRATASSAAVGSARNWAACAGSSSSIVVAANRRAVVVFPIARGPRMDTAGNVAMISSRRWSISLGT